MCLQFYLVGFYPSTSLVLEHAAIPFCCQVPENVLWTMQVHLIFRHHGAEWSDDCILISW